METSEEEEVDRVLKAALLTVGAAVVESAEANVKCPGVFVEVLKSGTRFMELDWSSVDTVECIFAYIMKRRTSLISLC